MPIRDMTPGDVPDCFRLVFENWGPTAAQRFIRQAEVMFSGGSHSPHFYVVDGRDGRIAGFSAFEPTMLMKGAFNLIWIAIAKDHRGLGLGKALTERRLEAIRSRGGTTVQLVTQKPDYFKKFGFFKLTELDNGWWLMLNRLGPVEI